MKTASLHKLKDQASKLYRSHFLDLVYQMFKIKNTWKNVLYIHSPFCSKKCKYCVYHSFVPSLEQKNAFYQSYLPNQIKEYHKILNEVAFDEVYFGGGTPTVADSKTLERIFDNIPHFKDIPTKMIEVHPHSLTQTHIDLFSKFGFKYISMGVQTLSTRILKKQNRLPITRKKLASICSRLARTGIIFNIDLIFFLESGDLSDLKQGKKDLIYVLSVLQPTSVVIHLNYRVKKSREKNEEVIRLIKHVLRLFPRYKCVNSLLQQKDASNDSRFNAEYRLMRDDYDFEFYLLGKYPNLPVYGYNIVGIGYYNNMSITSNHYYSYFRVLDSNILWQQSELVLAQIQSLYTNYQQIRKALNLSCSHFSDIFFLDKKSKTKMIQITNKVKKNPLVINLPEPKKKYIFN